MDHTTKEIIKMTKEMGKDILNQNKEVSKANGRTIKSKAPVIQSWVTMEQEDNGKKIINMKNQINFSDIFLILLHKIKIYIA